MWLECIVLVGLARLLYLLVAYVATSFLAEGTGSSEVGFAEAWVHWDAVHFIEVARYGYTDPATDPHATAFFPLFPLAMKALVTLGASYEVAGMLIATAATLVASVFLYRLADEELGDGSGRRAVLYLLFFPTAVFLVAPYSEALFLAGAIPAFYYGRRGKLLMAALPAAVATGARAAGIFVLCGLAVEFFSRRRHRGVGTLLRAGIVGAVALVPLVAYSLYLAAVKGDALYYFTDQRLGWSREFTNPLDAFATTWRGTNVPAGQGNLTNFVVGWRIEILAAVIGVGFVVWAVMRREWGYAAFMGTFMAALLTSSFYFSIPRMLLSMFPIVLFLAAWTKRSGLRHELLLLVLGSLAVLGTVIYTGGAWFF